MESSDLIRAAGGLVWKYAGGEWRIAVVHRNRHGDEWTLPKGKLKDGETYADGARREVSEETGCKVELRAFRDALWYPVNGTPKLVLFWDMKLLKEGKLVPGDEIDAVDWWLPSRARAELLHLREREIIPDGPALSVDPVTLDGTYVLEREKRLAEAISAWSVELETVISNAHEKGDDPWTWANTSRELLHRATRALAPGGDIDQGWHHFNAAQRWSLQGANEHELAVKERALIEEANAKLSSWRKQLVLHALEPGKNGAATLSARRAAIAEAALARDEFNHNQYRKLRALRSQLALLGAILLGLTAIAAMIATSSLDSKDVLLAVIFGGVGAAISGMRDLTRRTSRARMPEVLAQWTVTVTRVAIGAASGLVAYAAVRGKILPVEAGAWAICVLAFAFGFSESWVLRVVDLAGARERPSAAD